VGLLAVAAPGSQSTAEPLPVSYDVDFLALVIFISAGDPLLFSLFDNAECSGPALHNEALVAGSDEVPIEWVLPVPVRGQIPEPRLGARLRATLDAPGDLTTVFLQVEGNGIVPAGGECQPQAFGVAGPPGPPGPEGPPGVDAVQFWWRQTLVSVSAGTQRRSMQSKVPHPL
jgi:hypothetical protein